MTTTKSIVEKYLKLMKWHRHEKELFVLLLKSAQNTYL